MNTGAAAERQRLDKWLWHARFFRTRSMAARAVAEGVRINGERTVKAAATVRPGDVLTFVQAERVRLIEIAGLAPRRGSATEAQDLYRDMDGAPEPKAERHGPRPTGRDRRDLDRLRRSVS
jgi:ribosome-associated heat shock protein Hsp15